ncbi:MAG: Bug family tripartite tricarboxylate transporter substrate binding protein [Rhodospirillaceae bacterium]
MQLLSRLTYVLAFALACAPALGQKFPSKPIEIVVGGSAGGGWDTTARAIMKALQDEKIVGVPINVLNKSGGSGSISWAYLNQHKGDGHYVAMSSTIVHANELLGRSTQTLADFTPIAMLTTEWHAVAVKKESPIKTGRDLMDRLKQDPGSLSVGIALGVGNDDYMSFMKAAKAAGVDVKGLKRLVIFPSGQELMVALLGGHVDVISTGLSEIAEQYKSGKARILAISADKRQTGDLAAVPTWNEQGIDGKFGHWRGLFGPKDMPAAELKAWEDMLGRMVKTRTWKELLARYDWDDAFLPGEQYKAYLEEEHRQFAATFKEMNIVKKK